LSTFFRQIANSTFDLSNFMVEVEYPVYA